jgi:Promethin
MSLQDGPITTRRDYTRRNNDLTDSLIIEGAKICSQIRNGLDRVLHDLKIYEFFDKLILSLSQHPFIALAIAVTLITMTLPFLIFTLFAVTTALMTFAGFVLVEGTLITMASILLFGFLGCVSMVLVLFGGLFIVGYFGLCSSFGYFESLRKVLLR